MKKFNLDPEDLDVEDVMESLTEASNAWNKVVSDSKKDNRIKRSMTEMKDGEDDDEVLENLVQTLGGTYSAEEHGRRLRELGETDSKNGSVLLKKDIFEEWYIEYLYGEQESDVEDEEDEEDDGEEGGKEKKKEVAKGDWSSMKWTRSAGKGRYLKRSGRS
jgi:hypothetical protein